MADSVIPLDDTSADACKKAIAVLIRRLDDPDFIQSLPAVVFEVDGGRVEYEHFFALVALYGLEIVEPLNELLNKFEILKFFDGERELKLSEPPAMALAAIDPAVALSKPYYSVTPSAIGRQLSSETKPKRKRGPRRAEIPSVDAPFYCFLPLLEEKDWLLNARYPQTQEEAALHRTRRKVLLELEPDAPVSIDLFDRNQFPLEPHLIEKTVRARGAKPTNITHWNKFSVNYKNEIHGHYGNHQVVSDEWKNAVEALEPGVHEFFPYTIEFDSPEGANTYAAFVMRDRVAVSRHEPARYTKWDISNEDGSKTWFFFDSSGYEMGHDIVPVTLLFAKSAVSDRHWFRAGSFNDSACKGFGWNSEIFISKSLLERLLPLMPKRSYFIPAYVA